MAGATACENCRNSKDLQVAEYERLREQEYNGTPQALGETRLGLLENKTCKSRCI